MQCLYAVLWTLFDYYKLLSSAIYYFRRSYTTFGGHILLSTPFGRYILLLTAIYYFRRVYTTFDGYILLLALSDFDFVRIQDFPAVSSVMDLKVRPKFNINSWALIQFCFYCSSMVSSINFNLPFWKCCFLRNTQMLKMWNFLHFALPMVSKGNK